MTRARFLAHGEMRRAADWTVMGGHVTDQEFLSRLADHGYTCDPAHIRRCWGRWIPTRPGEDAIGMHWYQCAAHERGATRLTFAYNNALWPCDCREAEDMP